jgi:hypothetical protein
MPPAGGANRQPDEMHHGQRSVIEGMLGVGF